MKSFEPGFIEGQPITQNLLRTVRLLGEFKQQIPQALETLRQAAIIQSTESSNRIEGVTAPLERIQALVSKKTTPRNRSEQEIAGYRDVLQTIHANHAHIPLTTGVVLQLHRDLYRYAGTTGGVGSQWTTKLWKCGQTAQRLSAFDRCRRLLHLKQWSSSTSDSTRCGGRET